MNQCTGKGFTSGIRPPTNIHSPKKLSEMSAAAVNARPNVMPAPGNGLKRKTLADRAGETSRPAPAPPTSRPPNTCAKSSSKFAASHEMAFSSSLSSRPQNGFSLHSVSNNSHSNSVGSGSRLPSAQSFRPQSSTGYSRIQRPMNNQVRPATALDVRREESKGQRRGDKAESWDTDSRLDELENQHARFREEIGRATNQSNSLHDMVQVYKLRITELESIKTQLSASNSTLQIDLEVTKARLVTSADALEDLKRNHRNQIEDIEHHYRRKMDDVQHEAEIQSRRLIREEADRLEDVRRTMGASLEEAQLAHQKKIQKLEAEGQSTQKEAQAEVEKQRIKLCSLQEEANRYKLNVLHEKNSNNELRAQLTEMSRVTLNLENNVQRLESHIKFLESDNKSQSQAFADLETRMQNAIKSAAEANEKLIKEETLRRKLHNQVQELRGNIRVFCRARPALPSDPADNTAKISYPDDDTDSKEIEVMGFEEKSSLGNITTKKNLFAFDRVFGSSCQNDEIFSEISQLVQSALDGYNVCIFCYGQTGSGKTYTMSSSDGMIPRAVQQIYTTAKLLKEKGWRYKMEGSFVEVYNENLNDLLGKAEDIDKKKHEIKHDLQKGKTIITNIEVVELDSPTKVTAILSRAASNRSVAATQANERSSRSHSVFILKLLGENAITGEQSEGTLNLVDLAGSERLSHSQATGERLKETQNINKSLSCLGDVIGALGQGKEGNHVPYRNSKLTYLLQNSLGGNSKTLMFVMISPLQAHLSETLTSLKFATKVHNTHIGTAKRLSKV